MNTEKTLLENESQPSCLGAVSCCFFFLLIINILENNLKISLKKVCSYQNRLYICNVNKA